MYREYFDFINSETLIVFKKLEQNLVKFDGLQLQVYNAITTQTS